MTRCGCAVVCCEQCRAEPQLSCPNGCVGIEGVVVAAEDRKAFAKNGCVPDPSMAPMRERKKTSKKAVKYPVPTHCWCGAPVVPKPPGRGRPPTKCELHWMPQSRRAQKVAA